MSERMGGFWRAGLSSLALLATAPAAAEGIDNPAQVVNEIIGALREARAADAANAVRDYVGATATSSNMEAVRNGFNLLTRGGPADFVAEISHKSYGDGVQIITEYVHFPHAEESVNHFMFVEFTFMRQEKGWTLTNFNFSTSGVYPPRGWTER